MNIDDFDIAFSDMGTDISFGQTSFRGIFDCPDEIINGMAISTDYVITTKTSNVSGLSEESVLTIEGQTYEVRKMVKTGDGKLTSITVSKL